MIKFKQSTIILVDDADKEETVVKSVIPFLNHRVELDGTFTLKDFFKIIAKEEDVYELVFASHLGHFPIHPYVDEALNKECPLDDIPNEINHLELHWGAEIWDDVKYYEKHVKPAREKKKKGKKLYPLEEMNFDHEEPDPGYVPEVQIWSDFHGWGLWRHNENTPEGTPAYGGIAIEFSPIHHLTHLPIILNENFELYDVLDDNKLLLKGTRKFTVYDIFGSILSELSFMGSPENRDSRREEIFDDAQEMMDRIKENDDESNSSFEKWENLKRKKEEDDAEEDD